MSAIFLILCNNHISFYRPQQIHRHFIARYLPCMDVDTHEHTHAPPRHTPLQAHMLIVFWISRNDDKLWWYLNSLIFHSDSTITVYHFRAVVFLKISLLLSFTISWRLQNFTGIFRFEVHIIGSLIVRRRTHKIMSVQVCVFSFKATPHNFGFLSKRWQS